ncbi:Uma2 family endonuclease [Ancylothrix sp. C2]|uniref:Uma2 family endonuclease n=1 Tax=Ancylothrix sp. D3o TaxID=2953691 RepID=UPI0021BAF2DC|nr:Uma2 family endonuclease [Ancylothrix sp. D3o]MCT7952193.1 Uma2 family endonuclease [Ancylothrix sp. D3o]
MVSQLESLTNSEIIYPESDGQPMANNTEQFRWIVVIEQNLEWLYADDPNVFVAADLFWYPVQGKQNIVNAPDVFVAFGRQKGKRGSYQQWNEGGVAPQVVFEILSPSNSLDEMDRKLLFYERYGVEEYYIYNPENNQLRGWLRDEDGLQVIASIAGWVSPRMGIRFELSTEKLDIFRPDGNQFFSYVETCQLLEEEQQRTEAERQRAETERQRAETERQRAETERQRAEEAENSLQEERRRSQLLAERLRQMGINPDEIG